MGKIIRVVAIAMCKDEADIVQPNIFHLLEEGVDDLLIADNNSTDGTRDLLADMASNYPAVHILDDPEIGYYQSRKMTDLAHRAHTEFQAEWIIPFDLDELWFAPADTLANTLRALPGECNTVRVPITNHFASSLDLAGTNPFRTMIYRQPAAQALPKVAFRYTDNFTVQQGNHSIEFHDAEPVPADGLELRHFPYRSFEHFVRKARNGGAAYGATDLPEDMGAHWRGYSRILDEHGEDALREVFTTYFWFLSPLDAGLIRDPAPYRRWRPGATP